MSDSITLDDIDFEQLHQRLWDTYGPVHYRLFDVNNFIALFYELELGEEDFKFAFEISSLMIELGLIYQDHFVINDVRIINQDHPFPKDSQDYDWLDRLDFDKVRAWIQRYYKGSLYVTEDGLLIYVSGYLDPVGYTDALQALQTRNVVFSRWCKQADAFIALLRNLDIIKKDGRKWRINQT